MNTIIAHFLTSVNAVKKYGQKRVDAWKAQAKAAKTA